jgi:hypothetical protein
MFTYWYQVIEYRDRKMIQTKTIAMILLIAIATIGALGIGIGTAIQSVQAQSSGNPHLPAREQHLRSFADEHKALLDRALTKTIEPIDR